jgi:protein translocase SecG subunit
MKIVPIIQIIVSVFIIVLILLQERSAGLSGLFGGEGGGFYQTRRGVEKLIFIATIILTCVFAGLAIFQLIT